MNEGKKKKTTSKGTKAAAPVVPLVMCFETFQKLDSWALRNLEQSEPSCFNGMVRVQKFKVTIEPVDEPIEMIHARLQKLWNECKNHHHWEPLKREAARFGLKLEHRC